VLCSFFCFTKKSLCYDDFNFKRSSSISDFHHLASEALLLGGGYPDTYVQVGMGMARSDERICM
jgi:hypothetical protein